MADPVKLRPVQDSTQGFSHDTLTNLVTGLGVSGRDRNMGSTWIDQGRIPVQQLETMYRTEWLAAAVVDYIPEDTMREWRTFDGLEGPQDARRGALHSPHRGDFLTRALRSAEMLIRDAIESVQRPKTAEGYLRVPAAFARSGVHDYFASQVGISGRSASEVVQVNRPPGEAISGDFKVWVHPTQVMPLKLHSLDEPGSGRGTR